MTNEEVKIFINNLQPSATFDESGEFLNIETSVADFKSLLDSLFQQGFHYLFCLTCVDWKTHLTMVYHLSSTRDRNSIVVKVKLDRGNPEIETVSKTWRTAEMLEREVFELFGVNFINHPDLRKLILTDDFVGFPLRKDFEDAVNMIKL